jgi:hypothetical protein
VEVEAVGSCCVRVKLHCGRNLSARGLEAKGKSAAAGKQIQNARGGPGSEAGDFLINGVFATLYHVIILTAKYNTLLYPYMRTACDKQQNVIHNCG